MAKRRIEPLDLVLGPPVVGPRLGPQSDLRKAGIELQPLLADRRAHEVSHQPLGGAGILGLDGDRSRSGPERSTPAARCGGYQRVTEVVVEITSSGLPLSAAAVQRCTPPCVHPPPGQS